MRDDATSHPRHPATANKLVHYPGIFLSIHTPMHTDCLTNEPSLQRQKTPDTTTAPGAMQELVEAIAGAFAAAPELTWSAKGPAAAHSSAGARGGCATAAAVRVVPPFPPSVARIHPQLVLPRAAPCPSQACFGPSSRLPPFTPPAPLYSQLQAPPPPPPPPLLSLAATATAAATATHFPGLHRRRQRMNPPRHDEIEPAETNPDAATKAGSSHLELGIIGQNGGMCPSRTPLPQIY